MKSIRLRLVFAIALVPPLPFFGPAATMQQAAQAPSKKLIGIDEIISWKNIGATSLSNSGEWFAYRVAPQEGDAELIVRNVATGKETKFTLGEVGAPTPAAAPTPPPPGTFIGGAALAFSDDSKWIAFN